MNDDSDKTTSPPQEFVCPLTMDVMSYPVKQPGSQYSFEREAILNWIYKQPSGNPLCPLTRKPIHPSELKLDTKLQASIVKWKMEQDFCGSSHSSDDDSDSDFDAAFEDILAITGRIQSMAVANRSRRTDNDTSSADLSAEGRPVESDAVSRNFISSHVGTNTDTSRLDAIRSRVLQRRDDRMKDILASQNKSVETQEETVNHDMSLQHMLGRM